MTTESKKHLKFGLKSYFEPTPKNLKRLGDSLLGIAVFSGGLTYIEFGKLAGIIVFIIGAIGKFLSNFFAEDDDENCDRFGEDNDPDLTFRGPKQDC